MYLYRCAKSKSEFVISRSKVLNDLKMGTDMYTNHLNKLKQSGYISSEPSVMKRDVFAVLSFILIIRIHLKGLKIMVLENWNMNNSPMAKWKGQKNDTRRLEEC